MAPARRFPVPRGRRPRRAPRRLSLIRNRLARPRAAFAGAGGHASDGVSADRYIADVIYLRNPEASRDHLSPTSLARDLRSKSAAYVLPALFRKCGIALPVG
jgi:hypothetical protein